MVVTGAGPGIMAAGMEGAGRDQSIGVNIRLPHEQGANRFIAQDPKLVEMRYFFTRKLMLHEGVRRLHRPARRLRHPRRGVRAADPAPDGQGRAGPGGPARRARRAPSGRGGAGSWPTRSSPAGLVSADDRSFFTITDDVAGGHRRAPRLLPQLPVVPVGRATCWCCGWPSARTGRQLADLNRRFADIVAPGSSARSTRCRPSGPTATCSTSPGWPSASTRSTTAGCAS